MDFERAPTWSQNRPKIKRKVYPNWTGNNHPSNCKIDGKRARNQISSWFWDDFRSTNGQNGSCFVPFWGSAGALGRLERPVGTRDPLPQLAAQHFEQFWRPNGSQKGARMEPISNKNLLKNWSKFDFWLTFKAIFPDFGCQNWILEQTGNGQEDQCKRSNVRILANNNEN